MVEVGFPSVWGVVRGEVGEGQGEVPGWVRDTSARGSAGGGRVVNLSGVRAVGVGAE